ncbi:102_t:CDS:2, partial [Scutellospora calospora]
RLAARHQDIADKFMRKYPMLKLDRSTITKTLQKSEQYFYLEESPVIQNRCKNKPPKYSLLETAMTIWVNQASSTGMVLSDELVKLKGCEFGNHLEIPTSSDDNRDQRPEDNELGSEYKNGENFISEGSENDEIPNSEGNEDNQSNFQSRGGTRGRTRGRTRERTRGSTCGSTRRRTRGRTHGRTRGRSRGRTRGRPRGRA